MVMTILCAKLTPAVSNAESITEDFNLCTVPKTLADYDIFMGFLNAAIYQAAQLGYNDPVANPTGASAEKIVNQTLLLNDPVQIINASVTTYFPPSLYPCIPWDTSSASAQSTLQQQPFNYLLCRYFPTNEGEVPNGTMFIPTSVQTETDPQTCKKLFNLVPATQAETQKKYHITRKELLAAKRIVYAYNEMDPTTAVGIDPFPVNVDRNASRYMFTSLSAHGEESLASYPGDKQAVVYTRNTQLQILKDWFGMY